MNAKAYCDVWRASWRSVKAEGSPDFVRLGSEDFSETYLDAVMMGKFDAILRPMILVMRDAPMNFTAGYISTAKIWAATESIRDGKNGSDRGLFEFNPSISADELSKAQICWTQRSNSVKANNCLVFNNREVRVPSWEINHCFQANQSGNGDDYIFASNRITPMMSKAIGSQVFGYSGVREGSLFGGSWGTGLMAGEVYVVNKSPSAKYLLYVFMMLNATMPTRSMAGDYLSEAKSGHRRGNITRDDMLYALLTRRAAIFDDVSNGIRVA